MILGIGTDIIEIDRIKASVEKSSIFIKKMFTENEITYFIDRSMNIEVIAGNFSAKEAVSKALGTGIRGFAFKDIEILRDELGKPYVILHNNANKIAEKIVGDNGKYKIHISISHSKENAIAYVILEGDVYENREFSRNKKYR